MTFLQRLGRFGKTWPLHKQMPLDCKLSHMVNAFVVLMTAWMKQWLTVVRRGHYNNIIEWKYILEREVKWPWESVMESGQQTLTFGWWDPVKLMTEFFWRIAMDSFLPKTPHGFAPRPFNIQTAKQTRPRVSLVLFHYFKDNASSAYRGKSFTSVNIRCISAWSWGENEQCLRGWNPCFMIKKPGLVFCTMSSSG